MHEMTAENVQDNERLARAVWRDVVRRAAVEMATGRSYEEMWQRATSLMEQRLGVSYALGSGNQSNSQATMLTELARPKIQSVVDRTRERVNKDILSMEGVHGTETTAILYLLFFDGEDSMFRRMSRGIPAAADRLAAQWRIDRASALRAYRLASQDRDIQAAMQQPGNESARILADLNHRALNVGVVANGSHPNARATHPLMRIREVMDSRTRGNPSGKYPNDGFHWQVNGYINTVDEIVRQHLIPPCGVNCRATLVPVSANRCAMLHLTNSTGEIDFAAIRAYNETRQVYIDSGLYPDAGFH
jgi:hypothetical protein